MVTYFIPLFSCVLVFYQCTERQLAYSFTAGSVFCAENLFLCDLQQFLPGRHAAKTIINKHTECNGAQSAMELGPRNHSLIMKVIGKQFCKFRGSM